MVQNYSFSSQVATEGSIQVSHFLNRSTIDRFTFRRQCERHIEEKQFIFTFISPVFYFKHLLLCVLLGSLSVKLRSWAATSTRREHTTTTSLWLWTPAHYTNKDTSEEQAEEPLGEGERDTRRQEGRRGRDSWLRMRGNRGRNLSLIAKATERKASEELGPAHQSSA